MPSEQTQLSRSSSHSVTGPKRRISWALSSFVLVPLMVGVALVLVGVLQLEFGTPGVPSDLKFGWSGFQVDIPATQPVVVMILGACLMVVPGALLLKYLGKDAARLLVTVFATLLLITGFGILGSGTTELPGLSSLLDFALKGMFALGFFVFFVSAAVCLSLLIYYGLEKARRVRIASSGRSNN
jgi:hypothetical protein